MKVLHVIDSAGLYGAEQVLLTLIEAQRESGCEAAVASIREHHETGRPLDVAARGRGIPLYSLPLKRGVSSEGVRAIDALAQSEGFDLIHSHGYKSNILLALARIRGKRLPVVATLHGRTAVSRFSKLWLYEWLDARMLARLDAVVVVSHTMAAVVGNSAKCLRVIHNGIDTLRAPPEIVDPAAQSLIAACQGRFTVGAIGRLSPEKGFDVLIRALHLLRDAAPDLHIVIIGDGPERSALLLLARELGIEKQLLLPGYIPGADRLLGHFDVFALTSYSEGLPMVILESGRARVPIVATAVGGITEVLQDRISGLLVPPGNPAAVAASILDLYRDETLRKRLGEQAASAVANNFSIDAMRRAYAELYVQLLKARGPTRLAAARTGGPQ